MEEISHACSSQNVGIVKQGTPAYDELEDLGEKIEGKWKKLGRRLHIDDAKLQEIHEAHDQLSEKGYHMLRHWKQENGSAATYQALRNALQHRRVQRQDLAEQFCYIHGACAIQLPAVPVPEEKETRKIPPATAASCEIGASSKDKKESSKVRSGLKRKRLKPNPERGNLSFKIRCASAVSRNSEKHDPKQARKKVDCYMGEKVDEGKRTFDIYSHKGLKDFYAYLRGHLDILIESSENSSIKITVKCRTLDILERLWDDYRSGHLNAKAEEYLITEKVKDELDMETITLTTTILEEDYLACRLSLMEISVEASADDGQVELKGDFESREHEFLEELEESTVQASVVEGQVLESREHEFIEKLKEPTGMAIIKTDNRLNTSVYRKKTNKGLLLHYQSHVDNRYKRSLLRTMFDRAKRLSSSPDLFAQECRELKTTFLKLKYPGKLIDSVLNRFHSSQDQNESCIAPADNPVRITLPFKDQKSADYVRKELCDLGKKIDREITPVFTSKKISEDLKFTETKPSLVNQQSVVYEFKCSSCDANYIGYTSRHLHLRIEEHRYSVIGKHLQEQHNQKPIDLHSQFAILKKCRGKFECLIYEMLLIRKKKPSLNTQKDSIPAKLFT
ncbi:hypothetical protein ACROYT_G020265 [Oculina patagonica]